MKHSAVLSPPLLNASIKNVTYFLMFLAGLLGPLGFAPFHLPGATILSLCFFFTALNREGTKHAHALGFFYGLGYFGLGVSWVIISIHDYGHLNYLLSGIATLAFIAYLSLFPASVSYLFKRLLSKERQLYNMLLFASLWSLSEYLRASLFTGFPWLIIGTSLIDTPLKNLFPILGLYGLSLLCCFCSALLATLIKEQSTKRYWYAIAFSLLIISPAALNKADWTTMEKESVSVGVVQGNLAMRDKWDEALFWNLLDYYEKTINSLLGKGLIILPESAIPLPARYLNEYLHKLHQSTSAAKSSLILGILQPTDDNESNYYNSIISLGEAQGGHIKRQLVPFGEYIPKPFAAINQWLGLPAPNILPGKKKQSLIKIGGHPIASLICYEIAYPNLLRAQMPMAQWIVSISDNGWFGHSFASYQQLQMAQVLSSLTGRFHIVVNNDGLSSVINNRGEIVEGLPAFRSGVLESQVNPAKGTTPWIIWGDMPVLLFCILPLIFAFFLRLESLRG